jgi:hypothetical protein
MSLIDHKVPYRSEAFLASAAMTCRRIGAAPGSNRVNLQTILEELQAHGVESIFTIPGMKRKGRLKIEIIDDNPKEFLAYVRFKPTLAMFIQRTIWTRFREGHTEEQVIVAHEIGHIMLHDDEAKQFSRDESLQINFADEEYSAEWQANRFADHLLVPTHLAQQYNDATRIAFLCNVRDYFAHERLSNVRLIKKVLDPALSGEPCSRCGDFAVVENAAGQSCKSCGYSRGRVSRAEVIQDPATAD